MLTTDWVFKLPWLTPLLSAWLHLPRKLRRAVTAATLTGALLVVAHQYWRHHNQPLPVAMPTTPVSAIDNSPAAPRLPALSSAMLYEFMRELQSPAMTQQRESFSLTFSANWRAFATFTNQIAQSNLAPQNYQLRWTRAANDAPLVTMELQLAPGRYQDNSAQPIALSEPDERTPATTADHGRDCQVAVFPDMTVQAVWPSRGYIQIIFNGRSERLAVNQMLEYSWQLLRIGSESVEFRWHAASPSCPQGESFTVAL
ncbi:MAG: hypothetical protein JJU03_08645 [Idiomarina sp.]|nr:hypothetical protein [Idiomarina sp.]